MIKISPFKSMAQMRLFFAKEESGELPKGTAKRWAHETKNIKSLPGHVKKSSLDLNGLFVKLAKKLFNPTASPPVSDMVIQQNTIDAVKKEKMGNMSPVEYRNEVTARNTGIERRNKKTAITQV